LIENCDKATPSSVRVKLGIYYLSWCWTSDLASACNVRRNCLFILIIMLKHLEKAASPPTSHSIYRILNLINQSNVETWWCYCWALIWNFVLEDLISGCATWFRLQICI